MSNTEMSNTEVRSTANASRLLSRRSALRLGFAVMAPVVAGFSISAGSAGASTTSGAPTIQLIDAVSKSISGNGSDTFVLGTTKPTALNTGPRIAKSAMTVINGDYTASTPNSVVQGLDVRGSIKVTAPNVTIQDCIVRGRGNKLYTGNPFLVSFSSTGGVIQFCDVGFDTSFGGFPHYSQNGIGGAFWTAYRNNVHDATDLLDAQPGGTCHALGNYLHDISFRNDDADHAHDGYHPYWSHSDGFQCKGSINSVVRGNAFHMYESATTSEHGGPGTTDGRGAGSPWGSGITNGVTTEVNMSIDHNWFWGGDLAYQCNIGVTNAPGAIYGNRVSNDQYTTKSSRYCFRWSPQVTMVCPNVPGTGGDHLDPNVWDPDGPNVPAGNKGKPLTVGTSGGIRIP